MKTSLWLLPILLAGALPARAEFEATAGLPLVMASGKMDDRPLSAFSLVGASLEAGWRLHPRLSARVGYDLVSGSQGLLFHGPTLVSVLSLLGSAPIQIQQSALTLQTRFPFHIFAVAGIAQRSYDFRSLDPARSALISAQKLTHPIGTLWGPLVGIGAEHEFNGRLSLFARAYIMPAFFPDATNTVLNISVVTTGLGWRI